MTDLEAAYNADIQPLMARILEVCERNQMPMFAAFQVSYGSEVGFMHSHCLPPGCSQILERAARVVMMGIREEKESSS